MLNQSDENVKRVLLRLALEYAARGLKVFPVEGSEDRALVKDWRATAAPDQERVREWWKKWPDASIGIAVGRGCIVIGAEDIFPNRRRAYGN